MDVFEEVNTKWLLHWNWDIFISAGSGTQLPEKPTRPTTILGYPHYTNPALATLRITRPETRLYYPRVPKGNIYFKIFGYFLLKFLYFGKYL